MKSEVEREIIRSGRLLWLFTFLPLLFVIAVFASGHVPPQWRNLFLLIVAAGFLGIVISVPIGEYNRRMKRKGFAVAKKGFSAKIESMAAAMRRHAAEIQESEASGGVDPDLKSEFDELRRVAKAQDKRDLPHVNWKDASQLRSTAGELELYAQQIRLRGGIFKLGGVQLFYGGVLLAGAFAWGCSIVWRWWSTPSWAFFGGAALIAGSVVMAWALVKSQQDPA